MPPIETTDADGEIDLRTVKRFLPYLWPKERPDLKWRISIAMVLVLAAKAIMIGMSFVYAAVIDAMQPGMETGYLLAVGLVGAYGLARFGGVLFNNVRNVVFEKVGQEAAFHLAEDTFNHLHSLSLRFHLSRRTGAVTRVIERGTKSIDTMLYFLLFNIAPTIVELVAVSLIFWAKFSLELMLATLAMVVVYIYFTRRITDWRNKLRQEMNELDTQAASRSVDSLLNYETVKYFNAERREGENYARVARQWSGAAVKSENSLALLNIGQSLITNLMMAGAMAYSVWGWSKGMFSTGDVVLVNTLLMQLFRPLDLLGMVYRMVQQGLVDMAAMFDLIDTPREVTDKPGAPDIAVAGGAVTFRDVQFGYGEDRSVLRGLSFHVPAGTTTAIVGPSGAGKSTIARLLFRFYDVSGGAIEIDGQDIRDITQSSLRAEIGIVPQDTVLFNETIGYNIAYGREGAEADDIERAAKGASIHRFIAEQAKGYDTQVGERGLKLSGGEKQRVAIARTLLKNPPVLILDEATSALDSRTESDILETLKSVSSSRTTLTIAHRLSTVTHADEILVLSEGTIAERGTHDALLAKRGIYADMWERQRSEKDAVIA